MTALSLDLLLLSKMNSENDRKIYECGSLSSDCVSVASSAETMTGKVRSSPPPLGPPGRASARPSKVSSLRFLAVECNVKLDHAGGESPLATPPPNAIQRTEPWKPIGTDSLPFGMSAGEVSSRDSFCPSVHRTDDGGADDSVEGIPPKTKKGGSGRLCETVACPSCKRKFLTFSGMRVHERAAHPVEFHAKAIAGLRRVKPRCSEEESRVIAEREARLIRAGWVVRRRHRLPSRVRRLSAFVRRARIVVGFFPWKAPATSCRPSPMGFCP